MSRFSSSRIESDATGNGELEKEKGKRKKANSRERPQFRPSVGDEGFAFYLFPWMFGGQGRNRTADAGLFRAALYQLSYLARSAERPRSIGTWPE